MEGPDPGEIKDVAQRTPVEEELEERARTPTRVDTNILPFTVNTDSPYLGFRKVWNPLVEG